MQKFAKIFLHEFSNFFSNIWKKYFYVQYLKRFMNMKPNFPSFLLHFKPDKIVTKVCLVVEEWLPTFLQTVSQ